MTDWVKEQKRFNKINLKKKITVKDYCIKYNLNYSSGKVKLNPKKARKTVEEFHEKKETEYLKKKPN